MLKIINKKYLIGVIAIILSIILIMAVTNKQFLAGKKYSKIEQQTLKYLEEGYKEDFTIKNVRYIKATNVYEITASPKDDENFEFYVKTGGIKYGYSFVDNYEILKIDNDCEIFYKKEASKLFRNAQIRLIAGVGTYGKVFEQDNTFFELLRNRPQEIYVTMVIYIFQDVMNEPAKKKIFLEDVLKLVQYLKKQNLKEASIQISIYDEQFFKDKDIDHILKISKWFHAGNDEFDTFEYASKEPYGLWIERSEFNGIKSINDIEKQINIRESYKKITGGKQ